MNWETFYFTAFVTGFAFSVVSFLAGSFHAGHGHFHGHGHGRFHGAARGGARFFNLSTVAAFLMGMSFMGIITYLPLYPEEIFFRAFKYAEFDISEISFSSYIRTVAAGTSEYIGIPAFVCDIPAARDDLWRLVDFLVEMNPRAAVEAASAIDRNYGLA